jgi:RNA polymerase sigma factor (sigma-70 family)
MAKELKKASELSINDALSEAYGRLHKWVLGFAQANGADGSQAEDLLQEACVKILSLKDQHKNQIRRPIAYLAKIIKNDFLRLKKRQPHLVYEDMTTLDSDQNLATTHHLDDGVCLKQLIGKLDDDERKVWFLNKREGRTWNEIGSLLGVPPDRVKKRFLRRIAQLRDEVAKEANVRAQRARR